VCGYDWDIAAGIVLLNDVARFHAGFHEFAIYDVEEFDGDGV
jgi:hypothetical protein